MPAALCRHVSNFVNDAVLPAVTWYRQDRTYSRNQ
jgi:hypothetical protein